VPVPRYSKNSDAGRMDPIRKLDIPKSARPLRLARIDATGIAAIHLVALLAFVPWFFSWMGVVLALLGLYVFGTLGISLCFHRMLAHRGVVCPIWLEHSLAILVCAVSRTPRPLGRHTPAASRACR
jgi:fatty-acid desaturase